MQIDLAGRAISSDAQIRAQYKHNEYHDNHEDNGKPGGNRTWKAEREREIRVFSDSKKGIYLRRCGRLCMHTLLSTDIESTAASVSLEIGGPSSLVMGRNCNPVTNIE